MDRIMITTECVADLPLDLIEKYHIGIIYYTLKTDQGEFSDTDEITAMNVMEYMIGGKKKALSIIPSKEKYQEFFQNCFSQCDEIIHISISSNVSEAYSNGLAAAKELDPDRKRIHVIDSKHLSSGQGLLVLEAARMCQQEKESREIVDHIKSLIPRVSTSFLAYNADYLYYNDKVSKNVMDLCQRFHLHPVLSMVNGNLTVRKVYVGNYQIASARYVKKALKKADRLDTSFGFLTYAGCSHQNLERIKEEIEKRVHFDKLLEQQASASISCNCGPYTFGVLYIKKSL